PDGGGPGNSGGGPDNDGGGPTNGGPTNGGPTNDGGPNGGGASDPSGGPAPQPRSVPSAGPADQVEAADQPYRARLLTVPGVGSGAAGRRSRAETTTGRTTGSRQPGGAGNR